MRVAEWLYITSSRVRPQGMQSSAKWGSAGALRVAPAPSRIRFVLGEDELRAFVIDVRDRESSDTTEFGLLARPWGQTRELRTDAAHPINLAEVADAASRRVNSPRWENPSGLFYFPSWVLMASEHPRWVSIPDDRPCIVLRVTGIRGSGFLPGGIGKFTALARQNTEIESEGHLSRVRVLFVADALYAPGLVRPGLVLEATEILRRPARAASVVLDDEARRFRENYRGCVLNRLPVATRQHPSLPGQPLEDPTTVVQHTLRAILNLAKGAE